MPTIPDRSPESPRTPSQRRVQEMKRVIKKYGDRSECVEEKVIEICANGDVRTTVTEELLVVQGETISSLHEVAGFCQIEKCGRPLTARTFRSCQDCGLVGCPRHCRFIEVDGVWLCRSCKWNRRWRRFGRSLLNPVLGPEQRGQRR